MKRKILSILLIIFMLSASLITIPVNAKIRYDETDNWAFDYSDEWTWTEGIVSYVTLDDYLNAHYVDYANVDKSQITTLYILGKEVSVGATYTIEDLSGLYDFQNLKQLCVMDCNSTIQSALEALDFSRLTNLEKLYLDNVDIANLELGNLTNLTYLNIGWKALAGTEESDYYKNLDLSKMEKLDHFEYYITFSNGDGSSYDGSRFMDGIMRAVVPPVGCEVQYNVDDSTNSWFAVYLKDLVILDVSTDKTSYSIGEDVVCTVSWDKNMQVAEYKLEFDFSRLTFVESSINEDYYNYYEDYYMPNVGVISVNWASLDETDLTEMNFTFKSISEGSAKFNVYPYQFATGDLDNVFDYATTASAYNYTITIADYIKDNAPIQTDITCIDGEDFDLLSGLTLTENKVTLQDLLDLDAFDDDITVKAYRMDTSTLIHEEVEIEATEGLGTGSIIKLYKGEELVRELDVIVYGDTNGDGEITAVDALTLVRAINNKLPLNTVWSIIQWSAAQVFTGHQDVHGPSAIDALAIIKHLNGKYEISQNY